MKYSYIHMKWNVCILLNTVMISINIWRQIWNRWNKQKNLTSSLTIVRIDTLRGLKLADQCSLAHSRGTHDGHAEGGGPAARAPGRGSLGFLGVPLARRGRLVAGGLGRQAVGARAAAAEGVTTIDDTWNKEIIKIRWCFFSDFRKLC